MERCEITDKESAKDFLSYIHEEKPKVKIDIEDDKYKILTDDYDILLSDTYKFLSKELSFYSNDLIFGKDKLEEIVSLEVKDNQIWLFLNDGRIIKKPMIFWFLSEKRISSRFEKLEGNLHYKYICKFKNYSNYKKSYYKCKSKDIFTVHNEKESAMIYNGYTLFKGLKVKDVSVLSFDIEGAGLSRDENSKVFLITNTFRDTKGNITKKYFRVDEYDDNDVKMIKDWCDWVRKIDPTVITGHNIYGYDLPYLQYCANKEDYQLKLGRDNSPITFNKNPSQFRVDGSQTWDYHKTHIFGRHIIDGMFLAVKYDIKRNYPSWGLKSIIEYEGLIKENRQFYDASKIAQNWYDPIEREKIVEYGKDDSDDSLAVYDLMIPSIFYMTQSVPKPFQIMGISASGAQLNSVMVRSYIQQNHSIPKASERSQVYGGISFGVPGNYKNVFKIDIKSMYPSIIRQYRIYPKDKDPKAYFLKMVDYFTEKRFEQKAKYKETREKYYDDLQASSKIFINSSFGVLGVQGLNFNDFKACDAITGIARQIIRFTIRWASGKDVDYWFPKYDLIKDKKYDRFDIVNDNYKDIINES